MLNVACMQEQRLAIKPQREKTLCNPPAKAVLKATLVWARPQAPHTRQQWLFFDTLKTQSWKNCETEAQFAVFPNWLHWRDAWLGRRAQSTRLIIHHYKQHSAWLHEPGLLQMLPGQGLVVCCMIACFRCFALGVLRSIRCFALPQFDCIQRGKHMFYFGLDWDWFYARPIKLPSSIWQSHVVFHSW